jgi:sterol desaturase/sphingolipid hydroxylase (fatty acid hydroxylase superfamily)
MSNEPLVRFVIFAAVLVALGVWELLAPRRQQSLGRRPRWPGNLGIVAIDTLLVRCLLPTTAVGLALVCEARGWGLFQNFPLPAWVTIPLAFLAMDMAIHLQHVMFHAVPALSHLHRMHHADQDIDVTTGVRVHSVEILLSMGIKFGVIAALGPPAIAVLLFEIALNATSMFNHIAMPLRVDQALRWIVVTPDMHRVHHSVGPRRLQLAFGSGDCSLGTRRSTP